jgi:hypothetical protein
VPAGKGGEKHRAVEEQFAGVLDSGVPAVWVNEVVE